MKSEVTAQSNTVGRLWFFLGGVMVLWLGLDQKRQHLFTEVRIPEARGRGAGGGEEKGDAKEGRGQGELVTFVVHL